MKKITHLTDEQKALIPGYIDKWIKIGLSTDPADRPRAEAAIRWMYRNAGLATPKIVWCQSPLSQGLTRASVAVGASVGDSVWASVGANVWASVWASVGDSVGASVWDSVRASVGASVGASVWDSVGASVGDSVGDSVGASVRASVGDSVWASVGASVGASVWDSVRASVRASVWDSVGASVRDSVGDSVWDSVRDSVRASVWDSVLGAHTAGWLSFYDFFNRVGLSHLTAPISGLTELAQSAGWALPHRNICWISERHNILLRDDRGRLHSESGPACAYPDGFAIHAWHGTRVPAEWIDNKNSLSPAIALSWRNVEQRRAACEILGWHHILDQLSAKTIDAHKDPHVGKLIEVVLPDIGRERFLRVKCGTGREFALPVPPTIATAIEAQAWTWGLDPKEFQKPEIRT